jgi:hypothetical protein
MKSNSRDKAVCENRMASRSKLPNLERAPFWDSETFGCLLASSAMGACGAARRRRRRGGARRRRGGLACGAATSRYPLCERATRRPMRVGRRFCIQLLLGAVAVHLLVARLLHSSAPSWWWMARHVYNSDAGGADARGGGRSPPAKEESSAASAVCSDADIARIAR